MTLKLTEAQKMANARVRKGAALLDKDHEGWHRDIQDMADVDMSMPDVCILGKVFGDYWDGLSIIFPDDGDADSDGDAAMHGFNVITVNNEYTDEVTYQNLHLAWENEVIKRARKDKVINA